MTFDPTLNPGIVNGQPLTPTPPVDRYLDALRDTVTNGIPAVEVDLVGAARAAGTLFGDGAEDALRRIAGNLGDLHSEARTHIAYLRRAIDEQHARLLTDLDAAHGADAIHRQLLDDARVELAAATVDATTRLMALQTVRRSLTAAAGFAATSADAVDWAAIVDYAVRTIDGATIETLVANPDEPAGDDMAGDLLGRWPRTHAEAGVAPLYPGVIATDPGRWAAAGVIIPEPGDTAAGS